jgi:hypothetical protein
VILHVLQSWAGLDGILDSVIHRGVYWKMRGVGGGHEQQEGKKGGNVKEK